MLQKPYVRTKSTQTRSKHTHNLHVKEMELKNLRYKKHVFRQQIRPENFDFWKQKPMFQQILTKTQINSIVKHGPQRLKQNHEQSPTTWTERKNNVLFVANNTNPSHLNSSTIEKGQNVPFVTQNQRQVLGWYVQCYVLCGRDSWEGRE